VRKKKEITGNELSDSSLGQQNTNATANSKMIFSNLPVCCLNAK
jgi:hypothetical protein